MRKFIVLFIVAFSLASACGGELNPEEENIILLGRFEVESTIIKDECHNTELGEVTWQMWIIDKNEDCDCYTLTIEDESGKQMTIALSSDGYTFVGGVSGGLVDGATCITSLGWTIAIKYNLQGFTGTDTMTLDWSCRNETCSVVSDLIGRQD